MATRDLSAFFDDGALDYPAVPSTAHPGGRTYRVPAPDAKLGLWFAAIAETAVRKSNGGEVSAESAAALELDDDQERSWHQKVLGTAYEEMVADGVSWPMLQHVSADAYLCFGLGEDVANVLLAVQGKAAARLNRASRKSTAPKTVGSKSPRASGDIPAPTRKRASTRSSTSQTVPGTVRTA